jgi:DNA-binding NtrC family response regulator
MLSDMTLWRMVGMKLAYKELSELLLLREETVSTSPKGKIILVIDDEECIRDSCRQALTKAGYQVETAMNGEVGLAKAKEIGPDVALVDLDMPGPHGLEVMDRLYEMSPGTIRILVTGNTSLDLEKEVVRKRRACYLAKPFTPDELNLVVRQALDRRNPIEQKEDGHGS